MVSVSSGRAGDSFQNHADRIGAFCIRDIHIIGLDRVIHS